MTSRPEFQDIYQNDSIQRYLLRLHQRDLNHRLGLGWAGFTCRRRGRISSPTYVRVRSLMKHKGARCSSMVVSRSSQGSTTGVTKAVVCIIMSVG